MTAQKDSNAYGEARDMLPANDQRQEFRLTGRIWVEVVVEASDGFIEERSVRCSSGDISANGLRVYAPEPLTEGSILPLVIELEMTRFELTGEVKWCFPAEKQADSGYIAGFALYASDQTSILEWKEAIAHLLSA